MAVNLVSKGTEWVSLGLPIVVWTHDLVPQPPVPDIRNVFRLCVDYDAGLEVSSRFC